MKKLLLVVFLCFLVVSLTADMMPWDKRHPLEAATVLVGNLNAKGMGTGFFITPTGYLVTAAHVVSRYGTTVVVLPDAPYCLTARIVYTDTLNDWAVLKVPELASRPHEFLEVGSLADLEIGDELRAMSHPLGMSWMFCEGVLSAVKYDGNGRQYIFSAMNNAPGSSGSALCDENNRVVGMIQMGQIGVGCIGMATDDFKAIAEVVIREDLRLQPRIVWLERMSQQAKVAWELLKERLKD